MLKVCSMKAEVFEKLWTIIINKLINNFDHFSKTSWGLTLHQNNYIAELMKLQAT